ncbi:MAG TPA: radical SAM protein [bacterium]|nr:radical SAM protein [bacterium]
MTCAISTISVKSALTKSRIYGVEYVINPYRGCQHGCRYCYATFMLQHAHGHEHDTWGSFVEVKENLPDVLAGELQRRRKSPGEVMLASVCDPYQPAEAEYKITRRCLELLHQHGWKIGILTRSPLVLRDLALLRDNHASVGFSIPTDNDRIRQLTEPNAPPIPARIEALRQLHDAGISTWAFIGPILPLNPANLHAQLAPVVDSVMLSALNYYDQVNAYFRKVGLGICFNRDFAPKIKAELRARFAAAHDA